jgi:hypothetical protein
MIGKLDKSPQLDIFRSTLRDLIPPDNELVLLAGRINWEKICLTLERNYSPDKGRRAVPVRKIAGLIILKYIYGCSDNGILRMWQQDPCIQYFCGEVWLREKPVMNRFDLVSFRRRIGEKGMKVIFYPELLRILNRMKQSRDEKSGNGHPARNFVDFFRHLLFPKIPEHYPGGV